MEVDDRTLYIGNVDKNVSEEILYELFLQAGPIERVIIPNNKNAFSYGFVTYKHKCSVDYAIDLFKGTQLFKKELSIKKRCPRNDLNDQQYNDQQYNDQQYNDQQHNEFNKSGISDLSPGRQGCDFQDHLHTLQLLAQNLNYQSQPMINFTSYALRGNWSRRNRPYDSGIKNYFSRPRDIRNRPNRDYANKMYHARKNRHRE